jgi:hypothetical protein
MHLAIVRRDADRLNNVPCNLAAFDEATPQSCEVAALAKSQGASSATYRLASATKRPDPIESAVKGEGVQMRRNVVGKLFSHAQ